MHNALLANEMYLWAFCWPTWTKPMICVPLVRAHYHYTKSVISKCGSMKACPHILTSIILTFCHKNNEDTKTTATIATTEQNLVTQDYTSSSFHISRKPWWRTRSWLWSMMDISDHRKRHRKTKNASLVSRKRSNSSFQRSNKKSYRRSDSNKHRWFQNLGHFLDCREVLCHCLC